MTALGEQMAAVKRGTDEAKVTSCLFVYFCLLLFVVVFMQILKRKIREKYTELQQNVKYQTQKRRFQELHMKLGHIKKLVVEYDKAQ